MSRTPSSIDKEKASSGFVENENEIEIIEDTRALSDKLSGFGGHLVLSDTWILIRKARANMKTW